MHSKEMQPHRDLENERERERERESGLSLAVTYEAHVAWTFGISSRLVRDDGVTRGTRNVGRGSGCCCGHSVATHES